MLKDSKEIILKKPKCFIFQVVKNFNYVFLHRIVALWNFENIVAIYLKKYININVQISVQFTVDFSIKKNK